MNTIITMWCIFDNNNAPLPNTLNIDKSSCLSSLCNSKTWIYELKPKGYTLRQVQVTISELTTPKIN